MSAASGHHRLLAAIVFDRTDDPDASVAIFAASLESRGLRAAGLIQERVLSADCTCSDAYVRDLASGLRMSVFQNLGKESSSCRVDPAAIAQAGQLLRCALQSAPDLLIVNRFGRLESENGGVIAEIGASVAADIPTLICVPRRYLAAWTEFAEGLDVRLPPRAAALEGWWRDIHALA